MMPRAEPFEEYLLRTYDKYSSINTLANPNSQFRLKDIYITQTLEKKNCFESDDDATTIDQLPVGLIKKYKKLLIIDTAGMGKSTIMKYMLVDLIDNCIKDVGIPIFIELNRLNKNRSILVEIQKELNSLSKEFDNDILLSFIQKGGFIFFLDGYDEISISDRNEVTNDIQTFISKAGSENYYILSSRQDDNLASFGDFQSFKIRDLTKKDAYELLTRYDVSSQRKISTELIKELKTGKYNSIDEYLVNPLLVSLLYIAFHYKAEIPLKKHQFYRQVYNALYNEHKLAQGQKPHEKRSKLDIDEFNRVLRYVGYECLISIGVQFDEDTILASIKRAKVFCENLKFGESDFLKDLMTSVPLFSKDGTEYKWSHKSLMEYFAARFIAEDAKDKQDMILSSIYNSNDVNKYINMLDIYYDIDYKGFSKNIILPLLEKYQKYYYDHYYESANIDNNLIEERISVLFPLCLVGIIRRANFDKKSAQDIFNFYEANTNEGVFSYCQEVHSADLAMLTYRNQENTNTEALTELLLSKQPELFKINEIIPQKIDDDLYKNNRIYKIDYLTGKNDINHFKLINFLLSRSSSIPTYHYFNFSAVKKKITKIKKEIELSKKQFNLLPQ